MDRVMVSWNVPNLVTINLMAWAGFLLFILLFQMIAKKGARNSSAPTSSGADEVVFTGGY